MHLIFERPKGRFKSNCNILALAWMPYYNETKFRQAQFEHHQRLSAQWAGGGGGGGGSALNDENNNHPRSTTEAPALAPSVDGNYFDHYGRMPNFGWLAIGNIGRLIGVTLTSVVSPPKEIDGRNIGNHERDSNQDSDDLIVLQDDDSDSTNKGDQVQEINRTNGNEFDNAPNPSSVKLLEYFEKIRPDRKCMRSNYNLRGHRDEIILVQWNEFYQKLATVDSKGNVLIWCKANEKFTIQTPFYNRSKSVADFKWSNDGKTALICYTDSFILVGGSSGQRHWHSMLNLDDYHITCASWTPNDEQLLLGVSNGNVVLIDLPHSELTEMIVGQANIRTMCWSSSQMILTRPDRGMNNNSNHNNNNNNNNNHNTNDIRPSTDLHQPRGQESHTSRQSLAQDATPPNIDQHNHGSGPIRQNSMIVNRRRLSLNCALFCRHCPSTQATTHSRDCTRRPPDQQQPQQYARMPLVPGANLTTRIDTHKDILAIDFANNTIKLFDGGLNDPKPKEVQVNLESYLMAWSSDGEILAVAGFNIHTSAPSVGYLRCKYLNSIKFYDQRGKLMYECKMSFTRYPITALTWAHNNQRLFVATGPRLHCARVCMGIPSLSLLALSCLHRHTKAMEKADVLKNLLQKRLVPSVLNWQSFNCPLDIDPSSSTNASTQMQSTDSTGGGSTDRSCGLIMGTDTESSGNEQSNNKKEREILTNNINVTNYQLPAKLKTKIDQMFMQTLRQPYDEQFTLNDIVWHVPKNQQRHYCTLICYTHEQPDIGGCIGHQYKAQDLVEQQIKGPESASSGSSLLSLDSQASDQYKIFILYVEYQGSLIPILKARRIGFLKPEFVIFDPERTSSKYFQRLHKVSDVANLGSDLGHQAHKSAAASSSSSSSSCHQSNQMLARDNPLGNCNELHNPHLATRSTLSDRLLPKQAASISVNESSLRPHPMLQDPYLVYLLINLSQQKAKSSRAGANHHHHQSRQSSSQEARLAIERYKMLSRASNTSTSSTSGARALAASSSLQTTSLPETSELVRIKSNIWGTKFKLVNVGNRMIGARALLGSVVYKASILHLQPRQIFLNLKDMSNYCVLCSMHHHTKMAPKARRWRESRQTPASGTKTSSSNNKVNLIDLPVAQIDYLADLARTAPKSRSSRSRHRATNGGRCDRATSTTLVERHRDSDKVVLVVGDNIRVAPKLELNQRYRLSGASTGVPQTPVKSRSVARATPSRMDQYPIRCDSNSRQNPPWQPQSSTSRASSTTSDHHHHHRHQQQQQHQDDIQMKLSDNDNDILTLSLDQGDQVRVEMSSLAESACYSGHTITSMEGTRGTPARGDERKMNDFLQANKTLKSIQTITKMIVDLSSRAQGDDDAPSLCDNPHDGSSPVKLFKATDGCQTPRSPMRYIPPDTPVHRPHRPLAAGLQQVNRTQSATSTPLKMMTSQRSSRRERNNHHHQAVATTATPSGRLHLDLDCPLPSPPPSVPFRRKLSTSAKRLFDGSLRSLTGAGALSSSYSTSEDFDSEDCEALVHHQHRRRRRSRAHESNRRAVPAWVRSNQTSTRHHQSQPCSPMRNYGGEPSAHKQSIDLAQLRSQVVQKLRQTTSWMSSNSETNRLEIDVEKPHARSTKRRDKQHNLPSTSSSCTKRSRWIHKSALANDDKRERDHASRAEPFGYTESTAAGSSSSSEDSSFSSSRSSSDESLEFSSSEEDANETSFINRAMARARLFRRSKYSASAKDLNELGKPMGLESRAGVPVQQDKEVPKKLASQGGPSSGHKRSHQRRRAKKSICKNSNCCCSREIKLTNRPPVWNEYSQVYQLDFGGRVTQESAKNLQIDFNGNLALQFGRVDKCTYTLDYKYPFNAVQAMSIALASLTQRLK